MKRTALIFLILCFLSACSGPLVGGDSTQDNDVNSDNTTQTTTINESFNDNSQGGDGSSSAAECQDGFTNDGPNGFLWKPISEGDGNLVLLFPVNFQVPFEEVILETIAERAEVGEDEEGPGEVLETGEESGVFDGRFEDGRLIYRFSMPGSEYTGSGVVFSDDGECDIEIEDDPAERND